MKIKLFDIILLIPLGILVLFGVVRLSYIMIQVFLQSSWGDIIGAVFSIYIAMIIIYGIVIHGQNR